MKIKKNKIFWMKNMRMIKKLKKEMYKTFKNAGQDLFQINKNFKMLF